MESRKEWLWMSWTESWMDLQILWYWKDDSKEIPKVPPTGLRWDCMFEGLAEGAQTACWKEMAKEPVRGERKTVYWKESWKVL
jgi:hypothetical protein